MYVLSGPHIFARRPHMHGLCSFPILLLECGCVYIYICIYIYVCVVFRSSMHLAKESNILRGEPFLPLGELAKHSLDQTERLGCLSCCDASLYTVRTDSTSKAGPAGQITEHQQSNNPPTAQPNKHSQHAQQKSNINNQTTHQPRNHATKQPKTCNLPSVQPNNRDATQPSKSTP